MFRFNSDFLISFVGTSSNSPIKARTVSQITKDSQSRTNNYLPLNSSTRDYTHSFTLSDRTLQLCKVSSVSLFPLRSCIYKKYTQTAGQDDSYISPKTLFVG